MSAASTGMPRRGAYGTRESEKVTKKVTDLLRPTGKVPFMKS